MERHSIFRLKKSGFGYDISCGAYTGSVIVITPAISKLNDLMPVKQAPDLSQFLLSPMPGLLVSLSAEPGQEVKAGEELAVIEAMKMENSLRAAQDCVVESVLAAQGDTLEVDQPIIQFESKQ